MVQKKTDGKRTVPSRLSMASRMLTGAVPAAIPASGQQEPWRNKKRKGKSSGK
jgi:hypothetical protein